MYGTSYTRHLTTYLESNTPGTDPSSYRTVLLVEALLLRNTSYEVMMIIRSQLSSEKSCFESNCKQASGSS